METNRVETDATTRYVRRRAPGQGGDPAGWISVITKIGHIFNAAAMLVDPERIDEIGPFPKAIDRLVIPFGAFDDEPSALAFLEPFRPDTDPSS